MYKKCRRRCKGIALVEAALVIPLICFLVLGGIDLLWAVDQRGNLDHVAINVAGCVHNNGCTDPQAAAQTFGQQLHMPNWQSLQVASDTPACASCTTVTLTYTYQAVGPWFKTINMTTTASADR